MFEIPQQMKNVLALIRFQQAMFVKMYEKVHALKAVTVCEMEDLLKPVKGYD